MSKIQNSKSIIFVRHGESEGNVAGYIQGITDVPLTANGEKQAKNLAARIKKEHSNVSKIFCSNLKRARKTAEIVADSLLVNVEVIEDLHEINAGEIENIPFKEIFSDGENITYESIARKIFTCKNSEKFDDFQKRALRVLQRIKNEKDENILVVSHGMFLAVVFMVWEKMILEKDESKYTRIAKEEFYKFLENWKLPRAGNEKLRIIKMFS